MTFAPLTLAAINGTQLILIVCIIFAVIALLVLLAVILNFGGLWIRAYTSNARVSFFELIGMKLRQVNAGTIVDGKIMAMQAGVGTDPETGITTRRLEAHYLAGGDVPRVINAIIAAQRADIDLDFDRAAAIDLAGRDVLDAVRTSVYPKVIDCPDAGEIAEDDAERRGPQRRPAEGSKPASPCAPILISSSAAPPRRRSSPASARESSRDRLGGNAR
jgi:uncharacterized protein YqfA (UPF0365 family)